MIEVLESFGKNLRKARKERGLSQEKLALDAGFDRTYISMLERGKRNPSLVTICLIASHLEVSPYTLLEDL